MIEEPENIRADRLVACLDCGANVGESCIDLPEPNMSHLARRFARLKEKGVLESERPERGPWLVLERPS